MSKKESKKTITYVILSSIILFSFIASSQSSSINFVAPTPNDNSATLNNFIEINTSISEANLEEIKLNWSNNEYSLYDSSLKLMMNFNNQAEDSSKYGNNGNIVNAIFNPSGKYGGAYQFDGLGDYIEIQNSNSLNISNNKITLEAWIYPNVKTPWDRVIDKNNRKWGLMFDDSTDNKIIFQISTTSSTSLSSSSAIPINQWTYIVGVYDGNAMKIYVNAVAENSIAKWGNIDTHPGPVVIGMEKNFPTYSFNGLIDEVKIWDKALSQEEISLNFKSSLQKQSSNSWNLYSKINNLDNGNYTYYATMKNNQNTISTETRTIIIGQEIMCDKDGDGYLSELLNCAGNDCNDNNMEIHPGASEICGNNIDEDCIDGDLTCIIEEENQTINQNNNSIGTNSSPAQNGLGLGPSLNPGTCIEEWQCSEWSECINRERTRTCQDKNNCQSQDNKPTEIIKGCVSDTSTENISEKELPQETNTEVSKEGRADIFIGGIFIAFFVFLLIWILIRIKAR